MKDLIIFRSELPIASIHGILYYEYLFKYSEKDITTYIMTIEQAEIVKKTIGYKSRKS